MEIKAYAANEAKGAFEAFSYTAPELQPDDVIVAVEHCGICHSDLSMLNNDWGLTVYPFVGGHEVVGTIVWKGEAAHNRQLGQRIGIGWVSGSCMHCQDCMSGNHNLCASQEGVIVGRHGGFGSHVLCKSDWAIPIPHTLDASKAGPLFCGGLTVFNPFVAANIRPTQRVGVVGIGGLGHMALQFAKAWGCEVTAFSGSPEKEPEAREMGAHHFVNSRDPEAVRQIAGHFDMILVTVNVKLDWDTYIEALRPTGTLYFVGAVPPVEFNVFPMLVGEKRIMGSPTGSPATAADMLEFCARHDIAPVTEHFPMSQINDAFEHLHSGKARYRIVLNQDLN